MQPRLLRLYPEPAENVSLDGRYLAHRLRDRAVSGKPYFYSNFISSLDGRISLLDPNSGRRLPPAAIRDPRDWRLHLELAAQADAVLISGRRLRELCAAASAAIECVPDILQGDLAQWRRERGLPKRPACIVLSRSLDFPVAALAGRLHGEVVVITGNLADGGRRRHLTAAGIEVVVAPRVEPCGHDVYQLARERGYGAVYSIAGPEVLHTLLAAGRLDRLYLTYALRLLAGRDFDTLVHGDALCPPFTTELRELYFDAPRDGRPGLLFVVAEAERSHAVARVAPV